MATTFAPGLTMRLSDAGLHCPQTKLIYSNHRSSPGFTEDTPTCDRSNRLLDRDLEAQP